MYSASEPIPGLPESPDGALWVGMFGKHPAAADHLEHAGASTPAQLAFKRQFYLEGVGGCIHRSLWEQDHPHPAPLPYDHHLLMMDARGWIAARFVAARDASGRGQYPFVGYLHGTDHRWLRAAPEFWSWLDAWMTLARQTADPADLHAEFECAQADLRGQQEIWRTRLESAPDGGAADSPPLAIAGNQELEQVAHALSPEGLGMDRVRVPLTGADPAGEALRWAFFVASLLAEPTVAVVWKAGGSFADLAAGPPDAALLQTIFSPASKVPLTTGGSCQVAPEIRQYVAAVVAVLAKAGPFDPSAAPPEGSLLPPPSLLEQAASQLGWWWHR